MATASKAPRRKATRPTSPPVSGPLLTVSEVGRLLNVSREHARRLIVAGNFGNPMDVSGGTGNANWRVRREAVDTFLAGREYVPDQAV